MSLSEEPIIETLKSAQSIGKVVHSLLYQISELDCEELSTVEGFDAHYSIISSGLRTAMDRHKDALQFLSEAMERLEGGAQ